MTVSGRGALATSRTRTALLALSLLGTLLFGSAFALSFLNPLLIERAAREVVRIEVERRVGQKIDELSDARVVALADRALRKTETDLERTKQAIRNEVPTKVANAVADMLKVDCECRRRLVENARRYESERLSSLTQVRERLSGLIESAYASVRNDLLREFRIFTLSNAVLFVLLGLVTLVRSGAALQLLAPATALVGAMVVAASLYLFGQNWLHTIVFGAYVGWAYAAYLAATALLLGDVLLNRARTTTLLLNALLSAAGSAAVLLPC